MKLDDAFVTFQKIQNELGRLKDSGGSLPDEFDYDGDDVEERYRHDTARLIMDKLGDIDHLLEWIGKDVKAEGTLVKRSDGRYEIQGTDLYFSSGSPLEVYHYDEFYERHEWSKSRVEHSNGDYYIVALGKETSIEGLKVRVR